MSWMPLADAGLYCRPGRSREAAARWARRHLLPNIPHSHPPGAGISFRKADVDAYLTRYLVDPVEAVDRAVREATEFIRKAHRKSRRAG